MSNLLVMKFGGTSMGSAERIKVAARLAADEHARRPVAIVVSAMSKITDLLLDTMAKAEKGDEPGLEANLAALTSRHIECCRGLLPQDQHEEAIEGVLALIADFSRIVRGMLLLRERPARAVDEAVSTGEKLAAFLMARYMQSQGIPGADVNASQVIATNDEHGNAEPLMEPTRERAGRVICPLLDAGQLPVMTGFNASTVDGAPTTLGRGGSDFSASILAAALDAEQLWIWTDVDGIMSADPRLVKHARVLSEVTYAEAAELAYAGAKVLHPRTLAPLAERQIPVWSKNSFAPEKPGTRIVPSISAAHGVHAVTSMTGIALVAIEPANAVLSGMRVMAESIEALERAGIEVLIITSSSYRQNFCFVVRQTDLAATKACLREALALEMEHGYLKPLEIDTEVGLVAVVGEGMRGTPGLAGRIFTAISRENINIIAIAQGSSELVIAIVVHRSGVEKAVQAIHTECGLGESS